MPEHSHLGFALRGALSGALISAALAVGAVFIGLPVTGLVAILATTPPDGWGQGLMNALTFAFVAIPLAIAGSLLPSAAIGAVGGAVVGVLVSITLSALSSRRGALVGAGVGAAIAGMLAGAALPPLSGTLAALPPVAQVTAVGLPALLIVGSMALVGRRLVKAEKGRSS